MFIGKILLLLAAALAPLARAQSTNLRVDPSTLAFEVIAIHPDSPTSIGGSTSVYWRDAAFEASHVTIKELLREAYGVEDIQIQNDPRWMDSQSFTVEARIDGTTAERMKGLDDDGLRLGRQHMLQELLDDRFRLIVTSTMKQLPVYEITCANVEPRLRKANVSSQYESGEKWGDGSPMGPHVVSYLFANGHIQMTGQDATLDQLVDRLNQKLSSQLGRPFVNATNLIGTFDFDLRFTVPWRTVSGSMDSTVMKDGPYEDSTDFSLFSAFREQLGLKLKSTKAPVRTLWIERVEQPTEN
jgi:uncharacterized protein (TIGR03435 family)